MSPDEGDSFFPAEEHIARAGLVLLCSPPDGTTIVRIKERNPNVPLYVLDYQGDVPDGTEVVDERPLHEDPEMSWLDRLGPEHAFILCFRSIGSTQNAHVIQSAQLAGKLNTIGICCEEVPDSLYIGTWPNCLPKDLTFQGTIVSPGPLARRMWFSGWMSEKLPTGVENEDSLATFHDRSEPAPDFSNPLTAKCLDDIRRRRQ